MTDHLVLDDIHGEQLTLKKKETPVITGVPCIFIHVKDLAASKKWYKDNLGIDFDQDLGKPNCGKINLGLWPYPDPKPSSHPLFVLETPDLAGSYRIMKENGVNVLGEINWSCRCYDFTDPDGNVITMWQQDEEATLDVRGVHRVEDLFHEIRARMYLRNTFRDDWESFGEILLSCTTINQRRIAVIGWQELQDRLPEDAAAMVACIKKHNARYPSHTWTLEVRDM